MERRPVDQGRPAAPGEDRIVGDGPANPAELSGRGEGWRRVLGAAARLGAPPYAAP